MFLMPLVRGLIYESDEVGEGFAVEKAKQIVKEGESAKRYLKESSKITHNRLNHPGKEV